MTFPSSPRSGRRFEDPTNVSGNHPFIAFMTAAAAAQFRIGLNTSGQVFIQLGTSTILATSALGEPVFAAGVCGRGLLDDGRLL